MTVAHSDKPVSARERVQYREHAWFLDWLRHGKKAPADVIIPTLRNIRGCRAAWDWIRHCLQAEIHPGTYVLWMVRRMVPGLSWRRWLYGAPAPEGVFVVPVAARRLRKEASQKGICAGAGLDESTILKWKKSDALKAALQALVSVVAEGQSPETVEQWMSLDPRTREAMLAYAKAATRGAVLRRAGLDASKHSALFRAARLCGAEELLQQYVTCTGPFAKEKNRQAGLAAENFFIPSQDMLAFRKVAAAAMARHRVWSLKSLPGFDAWFDDWTMPRDKLGSRSRLRERPEVSPVEVTAAPAEDKREGPAAARMNDTEETIVRCVREHSTAANPLTGEAIARKIGFTWNSYFRQTMSSLVKGGHLLKVAGGGYLPG
jgi:hypothetical protein